MVKWTNGQMFKWSIGQIGKLPNGQMVKVLQDWPETNTDYPLNIFQSGQIPPLVSPKNLQ